jgi:hypothetical protein
MAQQIATDDGRTITEIVDDKILDVVDSCGVIVQYDSATAIGTGQDAYVTATVVFDPDVTTQEVATFRRSLPMAFDKTIGFCGGDTLKLTVKVDD